MKYALALASVLVLLPAVAEDAAKPAATAASAQPAQKSGIGSLPAPSFFKFTPESFDKIRLHNTNAVILDVRTPEEFAKGHIQGAVLLDFKSADFASGLGKLPKNKLYLTYCAVGGRSAKACEQMRELGFLRVGNLEGGIKAWQEAGKPVVK
jgi:rhodanese-related sulfurtransferase